LGENAPESLKEKELKAYFGRKIAIDASMSLYQFMIAVRYDGANTLTDKDGETTRYAYITDIYCFMIDIDRFVTVFVCCARNSRKLAPFLCLAMKPVD
jgi:hypothetical protein